MKDEETARFIGGVMDRAVCWRQLMTMIGAWHAHGFGMFTVLEKASGRYTGRLGPWHPEGWPGHEIGWGLVREFWGHGYAVEGSIAATNWAFQTLDWTEVIHSIAPDNVQSQRVAQKLGSRRIGPGKLPAPFEDAVIELWGQTRDEWGAQPFNRR